MTLAHLQSYKIISTFATLIKQGLRYIMQAPIVQWIEYRIPVPTIGVRLPMGVLLNTNDMSKSDISFFILAPIPGHGTVTKQKVA